MIGVSVINQATLKGREGLLMPPSHLLLKNNNCLSFFVNRLSRKFRLKIL